MKPLPSEESFRIVERDVKAAFFRKKAKAANILTMENNPLRYTTYGRE